MKFSIKKPGALFWKCGLTQSSIEERLSYGAITEEWLICPLGEARRGVPLSVFLANPQIFTPPKKSVSAKAANTTGKTDSTEPAKAGESKLTQLLSFLSEEDRMRFERVRDRSRAMTKLLKSMHTSRSPIGDAGFKTASLDKLLWLFLKMLHNRSGLARYLSHVAEEGLAEELESTQLRLTRARNEGASDRLITPLEDKAKTIQQRLRTYNEASENLQVIEAELDKTEQKINHICEIGMTSRDGLALSSQIDGVAGAVRLSESAMASLDLGRILEDGDAPPPLISEDTTLLEVE